MLQHKKRLLAVGMALLLALSLGFTALAQPVYYGLTRTFSIYESTTDYNSGPAAVKAVLHYLTGGEYSQSALASACRTDASGTYLKDMIRVINQKQNKKKVALYSDNDYDTVVYSIYDTVVRRDTPAIVGVHGKAANGWAYEMSSGHYIVVYGVSSDLKWFQIGDPFALRHKEAGLPTFYVVHASALYDAYVRASAGLTYGVDRAPEPEPDPDPDVIELPKCCEPILIPLRPYYPTYYYYYPYYSYRPGWTYYPYYQTGVQLYTANSITLGSDAALPYQVVNDTGKIIGYGLGVGVQKYDEATGEWKLIAAPSASKWADCEFNLMPGRVGRHSVRIFDYISEKGTYRLTKDIIVDGVSGQRIYSNPFEVK